MAKPSFPLEVLAAGGDGIVVAAHGGDLFVSGQRQALSHVCGAAVASQDQVYLAALTLEKETVVFLKEKGTGFWKEVARQYVIFFPSQRCPFGVVMTLFYKNRVSDIPGEFISSVVGDKKDFLKRRWTPLY